MPTEGIAGLSMEWKRNTTTVKSQNGFSDFVYNVQSASRSDSRSYSCNVVNGTEVDTSSVSVDVTCKRVYKNTMMSENSSFPFLDPAEIAAFFARTPDRRLYPGNDGIVYANTGENIIIECTADGNPAPVVFVRHSKDVPVIENSSGRTITFVLNITRAEGKQDNGVYDCQANNPINPVAAEKSLSLFV